MNHKKPTPSIAPERNARFCPECGKRAYSASGIHPQCAMSQADTPRKLQLAADRKAKEQLRLQTLTAPT
jgi:NADH pyrophosphatase NudC (nudix superfamily)